jgi:integrase
VDGSRKDVLLGPHGSPESLREYERVIATCRASAGTYRPPLAPGERPADLTVNEALVLYVQHAERYYPARSADNHRVALRPVRRLAGELLLRELTPRVYKTVRQSLIDVDLSRTTINNRMQKVAQFVKWCVAEELATPDLYQAIAAVPGLRKGRGEAKELPPVRAPGEAVLLRVIDAMPPGAAALARVQMLCGARAGELVRLTGADIDRSGDVWIATVREHKGEWRGKARTLYFGPKAQDTLAPLVLRAAGGYLFAWDKSGGKPYTTQSYRQVLQRAQRRAGVPPFGTHAIRHFAATVIRREVDIESARVLLGHSDLGLTATVYAERDEGKARDAARRIG